MHVKDQGLRDDEMRIIPNRGDEKHREKKVFSWSVKEEKKEDNWGQTQQMGVEIKKDELTEADTAWCATMKHLDFTVKRTSYECSQIFK